MKFGPTARKAWVLVVAAGLAGPVLADQRPTEATVSLHIPAQALGDAINEFGRQTGLHMVIDASLARAKTSAGVFGAFTVDAALAKLLANTELKYEYLDAQTIVVLPRQESANGGQTKQASEEGRTSSSTGFRVAQGAGGVPTDTFPMKGEGSSHQNAEGAGAKLEEVVVTAQKREERLLDVPISIVALGTDELENRKITSLDDLQFAVAGMSILSDGVTNKIELRGVSNLEGQASLVGVYIDEADVTNGSGSQINPNTYDLERVEVLRGPQGTLYGEGSAGGTIRFITKNPVLDRFGMTANVSSLFTQDGSPSERINTAINVPLIDQELGVRIVGTYDREGGWIDQPDAGLKDINGQDLTNIRIKALWKPSPQFSASFMAELYRNDRSTGDFEDANGNFTQVFNLTSTPRASEGHDIYNVTLTYELPFAKILNTTSYLRENFDAKDQGYVYPFGPPGSGTPPYELLYPYTSRNDHAWIEELRLSSSGSGPWQWTVGGFYRHYRDFWDSPIANSGQLGPPGTPLPPSSGYLADTLFKSWSVFGDVNYVLWERLTVGLGIRSFQEHQDYLQTLSFDGSSTTTTQTGRFHSADPRLYAQYKLSRDINVYASAAKGFRSGGFNFDPTLPTFAPEDIRTYELGTKMSLFDGQLHAETALFYTDYRDYVVVGFTNVNELSADLNAGNAKLKGIEWDFVWHPSHLWSLGVNGNYVNARFTEINAMATAYNVGDPLDFVPKYQVTSSAERDFIWSGKQLSMRFDYTRRGRMTQRNRSVGPWYYAESDVVNLLGYYMNLHWSESLSLNLFAQNLLNDRGLITPNLGAPVRSRPRTYGVGFDVSF